MNLHEYQAKTLFRAYGVDTPRGQLAHSPDEAVAAAEALGGNVWVVKAQVHAGGRGKAGGVKVAKSLDEVRQYASQMIGSTLKTKQTGDVGLPIHKVLIEEGLNIVKELYLSVVVDRASKRVSIIASAEGGMDIEEVAEKSPEKIHSIGVDPAAGYFPYIGRRLGFAMGLDKKQVGQLATLLQGLYTLFIEKDLSMVEINPLIITGDGKLLALDAKIGTDDNALYRHKDLAEMRDPTQEDERENKAQELELNYVALDGNIGCMVNGAGLAMATMDIIKLHGGEPANFLDVGGGATAERVKEAFKLILTAPQVKSILVNIFGGIVRCDLIAEGIINAAKEIDLKVPVVARLQGTNVELGRKMLDESGLAITSAEDLTDAAQKAVAVAK
ncbi:ADP-forming succinate--CoA ligase subunit beta [Cardiobacterium valvarum]|uniref:Succinate--CoA ligase [ADP-forming] subunit beta n=1 Tax=Cardiobacterium valvarum TaxID=194702 RepID=A0A381ED77_9GAMM|nr:ADP-forming succinate--CoA ligase subunit beta [Cardiobacterium valvarum]SUX24890.1 Succinyl-CoA ligase [ADP-forming] subunit beta [Cardiobacterium valvarum]